MPAAASTCLERRLGESASTLDDKAHGDRGQPAKGDNAEQGKGDPVEHTEQLGGEHGFRSF